MRERTGCMDEAQRSSSRMGLSPAQRILRFGNNDTPGGRGLQLPPLVIELVEITM
jgi:hypothetical protein